MKLTFEAEYRINIILLPILAIVGTIALSLGRNVSGCLPLWSWTIPVVILDYWSFCRTKYSSEANFLSKDYGKIVVYIMTTKFPIVVLFFMGLIVMADKPCRQQWSAHNPLLLYFSVVRGVIFLLAIFVAVFFHECWDARNVEVQQDFQNNNDRNEVEGEINV